MKVSRNTVWAVAAILIVLTTAVLGGIIFRGEYATTQTARRSFALEEDFTSVRKLLRKYGAQQIVTMGGDSEFISQDWSTLGGETDSLLPLTADWRLELHGTLRVRTKDEYIGAHELPLEQQVVITVDSLNSEVRLNDPAERLKRYEMTTRFERDPADKTHVTLELTQEILTDAPWFAHGIADRRVRASVERSLANQEAAIRKFIAENMDDVPLLPLR